MSKLYLRSYLMVLSNDKRWNDVFGLDELESVILCSFSSFVRKYRYQVIVKFKKNQHINLNC